MKKEIPTKNNNFDKTRSGTKMLIYFIYIKGNQGCGMRGILFKLEGYFLKFLFVRKISILVDKKKFEYRSEVIQLNFVLVQLFIIMKPHETQEFRHALFRCIFDPH